MQYEHATEGPPMIFNNAHALKRFIVRGPEQLCTLFRRHYLLSNKDRQ